MQQNMVHIQAARKIRGGFEPGAEYTDLDLCKVSPTVRNHGIQAGKGGANPYYPPLQTVGGSKPTATAAAERKHGNSFARGLAGGMITNSRG